MVDEQRIVAPPDMEMKQPRLPAIHVLAVAFGYALKDLGQDMDAPDIYVWGHDVLEGKKIPGHQRPVQDRFAAVCQNLRIHPDDYGKMRAVFFTSWYDWKRLDDASVL